MDRIETAVAYRDDAAEARYRKSSAASDAAVLADALGISDLPVFNVIGAVLLLPFAVIALAGFVCRVACWFAPRLEASAHLNGGTG